MPETLYVIDGNSLLYRSYYAIPRLTNVKGEPTNAIYGFTNTLFKILSKRPIDYIACAFDSPGPTFRHERFSAYKIHRKGMPEDLVVQLGPLKEILNVMNITTYEENGYEADDILATLADKGTKKKFHVFIVTGDKDAMQLVSDNISILQIGREDREITVRDVIDILGVIPSRVPDLIALMGDSSDGLPGIPGIGIKTAAELINRYGKLEDIYRNLDTISKGRLRENLKKYKDISMEVRELALLKRDVPVEVNWDRCRYTKPDKVQLIRIFRRLGFNSLIQRFLKEDGGKSDGSAEILKGKEDLRGLVDGCRKKKELLIYFEKKGDILTLAFDRRNIFSLTGHFFCDELKSIFTDKNIKKIGHGFKEIIKRLWDEGMGLEGIHFDIEIASYLLNSERPSHDLNGLSLDYLGKSLSKRYSDKIDTIFSLKEKMDLELKKSRQERLFYDIEIPLITILAKMEQCGIKINRNKLEHLSKRLVQEIEIKAQRIFSLAGEEFNLNSSQQLGRILFYKMGLPPQKKTKRGFSTDSEVLTTLAPVYPISYEVLTWRELYKIKSTYVDGLMELIDSKTGRLHTTFNQTVTSTGRLSSSTPNLQNIPVRSEIGKNLRSAFEADTGKFLMSSDYSQIELRILAHLSDDIAMKEAFKRGEDIHTTTAMHIFQLKANEIDPEIRRKAKAINFGIIYGISAYGLGKQLGISTDEAQNYIDQYMKRFPRVKEYIKFLIKEAKKNGFAMTILGRKRPMVGSDIERIAVNTPIQGSAADIIKLAMVKVDQELKRQNLKADILLQVHDELLFEVPEEEIQATSKAVKYVMENVFPLSIPLKVNILWGKTWADV